MGTQDVSKWLESIIDDTDQFDHVLSTEWAEIYETPRNQPILKKIPNAPARPRAPYGSHTNIPPKLRRTLKFSEAVSGGKSNDSLRLLGQCGHLIVDENGNSRRCSRPGTKNISGQMSMFCTQHYRSRMYFMRKRKAKKGTSI